MGGRRGCGGACSAKGATSASEITTLRAASRSVFGNVRGTAVPMGAGHCAPQEGIEPCEQHESQFWPSGRE
jgi:hypothetical protein